MKNSLAFFDNRERTSSLVNLSSSLLAHFGANPFHQTIPEIDALLKGHQKVALFLFDGMGEYNLNQHPVAGKLFLENKYMTIVSTNPATTVAATTGLLTGKYPIETGWLGWSLSIKEAGCPVDVFPSVSSIDGSPVENRIMYRVCPIKMIDELMIEKGTKAHLFFQDGVGGRFGGPKTIEEAPEMVGKFFKEGGEFAYIYFNKPDEETHRYGVRSKEVDDIVARASACVSKFISKNQDVLTLVIADHGLIDVKYVDLGKYPEITENLAELPSFEGRTVSFFIKEGRKEAFLKAMKKYLPSFALYTKEEILEMGYFGEGEPSSRSLEFIGDYIGIAMDDCILHDTIAKSNTYLLKAHHAGPSKEER